MQYDLLRAFAVVAAAILAGVFIFFQKDGKPFLAAVVGLVVAASAARFAGLEISPPGFYVDEAAIAAQVACVSENGHDASGAFLPLFASVLGGGYVTPTYLYPAVVWSKVFGHSVKAHRSLVALFGVLTVFGVFFLGRILWGRELAGWLSALCAAISPWGFPMSRIAWDPGIAPCFLIWGLYFLFKQSSRTRLGTLLGKVAAGILIACSMYAYPPLRAQVVLLSPAALWLCWRRHLVSRFSILAVVGTAGICLLPLAHLTISGQIQGRFNALAIWNEGFLASVGAQGFRDVLTIFFQNLLKHFSFEYLWLKGDSNLRHATGLGGQWSWLEYSALIGLVVIMILKPWRQVVSALRPWRDVILFVSVGYFSGVIPAALTWEGNPHALRSIGSYPFIALMAGGLLTGAMSNCGEYHRRFVRAAIVILAVGFYSAWMSDYSTFYPKRAEIWFDHQINKRVLELTEKNRANEIATEIHNLDPNYPALARLYFEIRSGVKRCH